MQRFVIQERDNRTCHFDFGSERDGLFKSWAVLKGLPEELDVKYYCPSGQSTRHGTGDTHEGRERTSAQ
jgi:hypothetical protein